MNLSLLCETVTGTTTAELVAARDAATRADMVELRLDGVTDPDISQVLHEEVRPGDRDVSAEVGGRPFRRQRGGAPPPSRQRSRAAPDTWTSSGVLTSPPIRAYPHRVVVSARLCGCSR